MEALTTGFCEAALLQHLAVGEVEGWHRQWPQPTLQIVDVQRYPRRPTIESGPCRFYLAASDGSSLVWLVVPPRTPLEEAIAGFELEVGCCVTLLSHTLVTAANGLNVVVPQQVKYSSNTLRLLGQPTCHEGLFSLSTSSPLQRCSEGKGRGIAGTGSAAARRPSHRIAVRDFLENPERALGNWSIAVRVVWRGREYQMNSSSRTFGSTSVGASTPRYVFRCLLIDERGDGIVAAFFGGEELLDRVRLHDCLLLAQGTVKWCAGEMAAPVELQFGEKSIEGTVDAERAQQAFPFYPAALVGELAEDLRTVSEVLADAQVGDFTSVVGRVVAVQASTQITTKRGRVWRCVVTLADDTNSIISNSSSGGGIAVRGINRSSCYVDATLWGDIAESVEPSIGELWVFHSCAVHLFQQRKTLSSRASTMAVQLRPLPHPTETPAAAPPSVCSSNKAASANTPLLATANTKSVAVNADVFLPAPGSKSVQFVLDLHEASPTLPVLAHVQEVVAPLLTWNCVACRDAVTVGSHDHRSEFLAEHCHVCGGTELSPKYHLRVWLSDGLSTALVTLHGSTAEMLLESTALQVARTLQQRPVASLELRARLVGVPVLMWLLMDEASESGTKCYIAAACKHVHCASICDTLLSAIEAFTGDLGGGSAELPSGA
ncbi:hypothetical protein ABL78_2671 [Leptomonas seymouri]|uniref:Uncharacterized protein n=1 Tax=Leptomonas seymouri TaxID=5684 RepID=A0A0N0P7E9_LEPSE|nr:hypothetical protein ABL78_2671 [Leptomonas seymouri]|eukprot:KPI88247.1 hypothetical protein ABL78_2671 [Leptomonas seymouri]